MRFKPLLKEPGIRGTPTAIYIDPTQFNYLDSLDDIYDYTLADCGGCIP